MQQIHLWRENIEEIDGSVIAAAKIEGSEQSNVRLWYKLPAEHRFAITKGCDSFVLATLFMAMRQSADLIVHGEVSPILMRNLEEFQAAWVHWRPDRYTKIEIFPDIEKEQPRATSDTALMTFSGGVDSSFTAFRHSTGRCGRWKRNLQAAIMIQGFDIPLSETDVYERAARKSKATLASVGVTLIPIATNFRQLWHAHLPDWEDAFGSGMASCLMLLQNEYTDGLIASSEPYNSLLLPWGSNPVTDHLMSSGSFQIVHDAAAVTRNEKVREIASWKEATRSIRVCWQGEHLDRNCGCCEKCIRTILNFRVMGLGLPECFEQDVSDHQIASLRGLSLAHINPLEQIVAEAKAASISDSWVAALEECIRQNQLDLEKNTEEDLIPQLAP
ncbi:MAG: hypothetical protein P2A85_14660 [Microcoleus anatoxicus]|uniref:hypothetical protein n=1 Tax=Microcoleus anatoxicus TaxID=2705319 RepID=UPI00366BF6AA